uniref:IRS-type PTB domain-containing protein n=1 Tax=Steinernema glaseri TaxID=37863 RepID=A0A1I8ACW1_9BILA
MSPSEPPPLPPRAEEEGEMTAVRESFINLKPLEIPRPKCQGMQFITTRGRQGFYQSIRRNGAQYGLQIKPMGPRRSALPDQSFWTRPETVKEEEPQTTSVPSSPTQHCDSGVSSDSESRRSSSVSYFPPESSPPPSQNYRFSQPILEEPEFPEPEPDYDEPSRTPTSPPPAPPLPNFGRFGKKLSASGRL